MEASTTPEAEPMIEEEVIYKMKTIRFCGRKSKIILQDANGPCPLVAICNVLLLTNYWQLRRYLALNDAVEFSQNEWLSLVAGQLTNSFIDIEDLDRIFVANQQRNDALELLDMLRTGIELDIKSGSVDDFAYSRERVIFDALNISLYHGWIVDPEDHETAEAIGSKSFNALMEELDAVNIENRDIMDPKASVADSKGSPHRARRGDIEEDAKLLKVLKLSEDKYRSSDHNIEPTMEGSVGVVDGPEGKADRGEVDSIDLTKKGKISVSKGEVIKNFMRKSSGQLTAYGLACLKQKVREHRICLLFRNNHFNPMFKYKGELYILVANVDQPDLVWEKLNEVNGDTRYMNENFKEFKMDDHSNRTRNDLNAPNSTEDSLDSTDNAAREGPIIDGDSEVALATQRDEYGDELPVED